jgi:hypothetical protein
MNRNEQVNRFLAILLEHHTKAFADCTEYLSNPTDISIQTRFERDHPALKEVVDTYVEKGESTILPTAIFAYAVAEVIIDVHEYLHQNQSLDNSLNN